MASSPLVGGVREERAPSSLPLGWLTLFLLTVLVDVYFAGKTASLVGHIMVHKGWPRALHSTTTFWLDCLMNTSCQTTFQQGWLNLYPKWTLLIPGLGLVAYALGAAPKKHVVKDPGLSWWARSQDVGLEQYRSSDPHRKANRLMGYMGHLLSVELNGKIDYRQTRPLYVRMASMAENFMVIGGVGAGKTRGYFRPLIMLGAHLGFTVIVFDLKFPQPDSGFFDMAGYWRKAGRPVMMFTPFSPTTMRLPLMDDIEDYYSALKCATTIMPPPEYGPETGKHYRDRDRGALAAFLLAVAKSDRPNFQELLRIAQYTPKELKKWFEIQEELDSESEVVMNLKGMFAQGTAEVASVLLGIKNALRIFYNPLLARATQSLEGENMDLAQAFRQPTLLYVGIQQEYMMEGDGVVLLQLTKRYIDQALQREAARQGGVLKVHTAYVLDEFPSFGLLPNMMRSLAVLRSYNVSHHLGVQNLSQLSVVYGENYANALTTSVIGRKIFFPLAVDDKERDVFSQQLGQITVPEFSHSDSRRKTLGSPLDDAARSGTSIKLVARPLLAPEEFPHFRSMEAVVKVRGSHPVRVFMPSIEERMVSGPQIPRGIPNGLNEFYRKVNPDGTNMGTYTTELVKAGRFGVSNPEGVSMQEAQDAFQKWAEAVLTSGARLRLSGAERDRLYIRMRELPEELKDQKVLTGQHSRDWTGAPTSDELRIMPTGWALLTRETRKAMNVKATFGTLDFYMEVNAVLVEGSPERLAMPEDERAEAAVVVKESTVLVRHQIFRQLYGVIPEQLNKRLGPINYIEVDLRDPQGFWDELAEARKHDDEEEGNEKTQTRDRSKKSSNPKEPPAAWLGKLRDGSDDPVTAAVTAPPKGPRKNSKAKGDVAGQSSNDALFPEEMSKPGGSKNVPSAPPVKGVPTAGLPEEELDEDPPF